MQIKTETQEAAFQPVRVTFVAETQEELDALGALVNNSHICRVMEKAGCKGFGEFWRVLNGSGAQLDGAHSDYEFRP